MATLISTSGATVTTTSSEQTIYSLTSANGVYELTLRMNNLANGDIMLIKCKVQEESGDTLEDMWQSVIAHNVGSEKWRTEPIRSLYRVDWTIQRVGGSDRTIAYWVHKI